VQHLGSDGLANAHAVRDPDAVRLPASVLHGPQLPAASEGPDTGALPLQLFRDIKDTLQAEVPHLVADLTEAQVQAAVQRYLPSNFDGIVVAMRLGSV
jgi:hypothetical protein